MIKETYVTTHVDVPKPDGSVFRITVHGPLTPEDEQVLNTVEASPKLLAALEDIVQHIHMDIGMQRRGQAAVDAAYGRKPTGEKP